MSTRGKKTILVELDEDIWQKVATAAAADDRTIASFARAALRRAAEAGAK